MLIQFNFKNFKSFREEVTLDLSAAKMTEFSDRVVSIGSEKILPVSAIYGANASGKSNIYSAFKYKQTFSKTHIAAIADRHCTSVFVGGIDRIAGECRAGNGNFSSV